MRSVRIALAVLAVLLSAACGGDPAGEARIAHGAPLQVTIEEISADEVASALLRQEAQLMAAGVAQRRAGEHGELPALEQEEELGPDAWPVVTIKNDTPHGLVVWFAGPCPRTVALIPRDEHTVELCEGTYDIAAELAADDFLPFVGEGEELENGYGYKLSFYVVAEPRTRTRVRRR